MVLPNQHGVYKRLLSFIVLQLHTAYLIKQKLVQLQLAQTSTCCNPGLYVGRGPGGRAPPRCIVLLHHSQIALQTLGGPFCVCTLASLMLSNYETGRRQITSLHIRAEFAIDIQGVVMYSKMMSLLSIYNSPTPCLVWPT